MELYIVLAVAVVVAAILIYKRKGEKEVPQGLQVFDENGNVVVDITDRLTKVLGTASIRPTTTAGTITNALINSNTTLWYVIANVEYSASTTSINADLELPVLTQTNGGVHWEYVNNSNYKAGIDIIYGVY